jgi:hypothetical protein
MANPGSGIGAAAARAEGAARATAQNAGPGLVTAARFGYAAKGAVYIIVGLLALQAALGSGGQTTDKRGALSSLTNQPGGKLVLGLLAAGLFGYALWRLVEAATDAEGAGPGAKGTALRAAHATFGVIYAGLGFEAARLASGGSGSGAGGGAGASGGATAHWTGRLMSLPLGRALVIAAGLGVVAYGIAQLVRAYKANVRKRLDLSSLDPAAQEWVIRLGRLGYAARGVVLLVVGWFLVQAALRHDPQQATGLGGALAALEQAPYGVWLLGLVAAGLIAYGLYNVVQARYRVIRAT